MRPGLAADLERARELFGPAHVCVEYSERGVEAIRVNPSETRDPREWHEMKHPAQLAEFVDRRSRP